MTSTSSADRHRYLIEKYFIDATEANSVGGNDLTPILERFDKTGILSGKDQQFLKENGLFDQLKFVQELRLAGWAADPYRPLRRKYGIGDVETPDMPRMMQILDRLENGTGLAEDDVVWPNGADVCPDVLYSFASGKPIIINGERVLN